MPKTRKSAAIAVNHRAGRVFGLIAESYVADPIKKVMFVTIVNPNEDPAEETCRIKVECDWDLFMEEFLEGFGK